MQEIVLPPYAPILMESTRAIGYSLETAIADLIDNSIFADATRIDIQFRPWDDPYLYILDNGWGMSPHEVTMAMRYGSRNPLEVRNGKDMGRFGLGLKTASLSQCRCMTVISKKDNVISGRRWDLDYIVQREDWVLLELAQPQLEELPGFDDLMKQESGTLVLWNNLDRLSSGVVSLEQIFSKKMDDVVNHIALVFHRYLTGESGTKRIGIFINKYSVNPIDPFLIGKSEQVMDEEPIYVEGQKITVTPFILPHISRLSKEELELLGGEDGLRRKQGFYVYRNKRLLVYGTWFRLARQDELYKLARVRVDIPNSLDHLWILDIRKSTATPPEIVRKNLERFVTRIAESSKRTWTFRGRKETKDDINHVWNRIKTRDGIRYTINRDHPLLQSVGLDMDENGKRCLEKLMHVIETGIPLNQLYIDLTEDEHFAADTDTIASIREMTLDILSKMNGNHEFIANMFTMLEITEPFSGFPDVLDQIKSVVLSDV